MGNPLLFLPHYMQVGGFKHFLFSIFIYGIILPIDIHICQDGYCTTNQYVFVPLLVPSGNQSHGEFPSSSAIFPAKTSLVRGFSSYV